jgi:putative flippase GtrA
MNLALLYALFACISTLANLGAQAVVVRMFSGEYGVMFSVVMGTGIGLVVKYLLDKRWIFRWRATDKRRDAHTFVLYTLTGVFTTLVFWGCEFLFQWLFHTESWRYVGACIGLAIGYVVKYRLDRALVFVD